MTKNGTRAQAARAHAFSRWKRVQKNFLHGTSAAFYLYATLEPVRRAFPNSPAHAVSNTWKGAFFVAAHATAMRSNKKSPHEPRNQILRALPWPTESYLRRSLFSTQICFVKPIFAHRMLLRSRWLKSQNSSHANPSSTETLTEGQGSRALRLLRGS